MHLYQGRYLSIFTIHERPADYPEHVVVTQDAIRAGDVARVGIVATVRRVDEARSFLAIRYPGLTCIPRSPDDPPHIVESWV